MKKKVLFVFGTRPEVIKMAPVIKLAKKSRKVDPIVCVTAQHRFLLDQALREFCIKPDIDLDLMRPDQSLYDVVSSVMQAAGAVYRKLRPDIVLVQGDTSTVFAASLAAYYEGIDIGHIEAGLRSHDNRNPFPEEINRRFVSLVAKYNFCPTMEAKENLLTEGVSKNSIFVTGNTIVDALNGMLSDTAATPPSIPGLDIGFFEKPFVLITGHRRENFDTMEEICAAVKTLAARYEDINWLWVIHLNPHVRRVVFEILKNIPNVRIVEPVPYKAFVYLMSRSKFIISDSGGVQEEAPSMGKSVLVTRNCTERPEAVETGTSILVGTDKGRIIKYASALLNGRVKKTCKRSPFGDGHAAERILDIITDEKKAKLHPGPVKGRR